MRGYAPRLQFKTRLRWGPGCQAGSGARHDCLQDCSVRAGDHIRFGLVRCLFTDAQEKENVHEKRCTYKNLFCCEVVFRLKEGAYITHESGTESAEYRFAHRRISG